MRDSRNHRRLVKATKQEWERVVPAATVQLLQIPIRQTVLELALGKARLRITCQRRQKLASEIKQEPDPWQTVGPISN